MNFKLLKSTSAAFGTSMVMLCHSPVFGSDKLNIVASFSILGDMVEQVVGELANVTTIVGPDADAHVYQPSIGDAKSVADADVVFVNGLGFETWSESLINESGTMAQIFVATEGITPVLVDGETDPHAWNSLQNGMVYVQNIARSLSMASPDHKADFSANAIAYIKKLETLDADAKTQVAELPEHRRTVVTAHDAFGYLADAYGLNFLAPVGIDTEVEPSAKDLAALIDQLKADGAGALFVENITSPVLVQQISDETGIKMGGRLYSDALSERGGPATSYEAMFQHNLNALITALSSAAN